MPPAVTLAPLDGRWLVLLDGVVIAEHDTLLLAGSHANRLCGKLGGVAQMSELTEAQVRATFEAWAGRREAGADTSIQGRRDNPNYKER